METETSIANFTALPETRDGTDLKNNLAQQESKIDELMSQVQEQKEAIISVRNSVAELKQSKDDTVVIDAAKDKDASGGNANIVEEMDGKLGELNEKVQEQVSQLKAETQEAMEAIDTVKKQVMEIQRSTEGALAEKNIASDAPTAVNLQPEVVDSMQAKI